MFETGQLRIFTEPQQGATYDDLVAVASTAERLGFGAFFRSDHYLAMGAALETGGQPGPTDAWITLAGLARDTSTIRLGTLVTAATFRLPGPLAVTVAGVDQMSGGRVEIGLGAGWYELESAAYGIELGPVGERMTRFEEGVEVIHLLLTEEHADFNGRYFQLEDARNEPKPLQQPRPPIVIGGRGEKRTLRLVARFASMWDAQFVEDEADEWRRLRDVLSAHCQEVGRDPREIACSSHLSIPPDPDPAAVAARAAKMFEAGIDVVILAFSGVHDGKTVESVAGTLTDVG